MINNNNTKVSGKIPVRLVNGPSNSTGRVEILYNNKWGTVCKYGFGWNAANVVCRQLGFPKATYFGHYFKAGSGQIWINNILCQGSEASLANCSFPGWGIHNCPHLNDISVGCRDGTLLSFFI